MYSLIRPQFSSACHTSHPLRSRPANRERSHRLIHAGPGEVFTKSQSGVLRTTGSKIMQPRLRHTALIHRESDAASGVELPVVRFTPTDSIFENSCGIILRVMRSLLCVIEPPAWLKSTMIEQVFVSGVYHSGVTRLCSS